MNEDNNVKVITNNNYCLFCGKELKIGYEDYNSYYYCGCDDYIQHNRIMKEITKLKEQLPKAKFEIDKQTILKRKI